MPEFTERIQRITADLRQVLLELDRAAHTSADPEYRARISRELLVSGVAQDFKTAVDDMRTMLWSYMSAKGADPQNPTRVLETKLQSVRMQRVTEMLKALEPDMAQPATTQLPEATTFLELIHSIAHTTVDRHEGRA